MVHRTLGARDDVPTLDFIEAGASRMPYNQKL